MEQVIILLCVIGVVVTALFLRSTFQLFLPEEVIHEKHRYISFLKYLLLVIAGIILVVEIILPFLLPDVDLEKIMLIVFCILAIMSTICVIIILKGSKLWYMYLSGVVLCLALIGYFVLNTPVLGKKDNIIVDEHSIVISGIYSLNIPLSTITDVDLIQNFPKITKRTNAMSLFDKNLGYFKMADGEKCYLYSMNNEKPIIRIQRKEEMQVFINCISPDATIELYNRIKQALVQLVE